jgi:pyruvate/2-oxoglutarate dehydrogenase complex dihydrolipoamide dehydrogenase (E3) component/uncharacterized membrane protein YdjX (TVP38/TMEM64 family)
VNQRLVIAALAVIAIAAFFLFDLDAYLQLDYLKRQQAALTDIVAARPLLSVAAYFAVYVLVTALSLPGATVLTLVGGGLFGLAWGSVIVSFASTLGATLAFLISRYLFRDAVARRFGKRMKAIDAGVARDGAFYLFTLRLVPVFPFFVINLVMGLTAIRAPTFALVSQIGMLPGTLVFVNAGTQLAQVASPADVLSPGLLGSFVLLGLFPLLAKQIVGALKSRRVMKAHAKPKRFERNVVVIGAGSAGLVAAYIAAATKASVTLIEKHRMGGDCLNTGCVPSKALLRSAKIRHLAAHGDHYGLKPALLDVDFREVMQRVRNVISAIEPHDSVERYTDLGVECLSGAATIVSPYRVRVGERELTTRSIIIAAGASPLVPPIPGLAGIAYLTSDTLWDLDSLPPRLLVLGGGPIGCEIAQAFARLGSAVTLVEMAPRLLVREDPLVSDEIERALTDDGITLALHRRAAAFQGSGPGGTVVCEDASDANGKPLEIAFDRVVVALGRRPNTQGYGLETLGVTLSETNTIATDPFLTTNFPNIYACGDVAGPFQFTHTAAHQAWYATINSLFGGFKRFKVDYSVIPWCTFTDPEVARVGLSETEAAADGVACELTTYGIDDLDRAIADGVDRGFVRVLTKPGSDRILGVTIVGEHAGDLIAEFVLAMKHGLGLNKILGTIHIYPTLAEANKFAAGAWRRAHAPAWLLKIAARYHAFRRGD